MRETSTNGERRSMAPQAPGKAPGSRTVALLALVGSLALFVAVVRIDRPRSLDVLSTTIHNVNTTTTQLTHVAFAVLGSRKWRSRQPLVDLWWRPGATRGFAWLEASQIDEGRRSGSPPFRVFDGRVPIPLQMERVLRETIEVDGATRWVVIGDDDTVFFVDNVVEVLRRYNHGEFYYIGGESESAIQNSKYYGMAFGGGGVALSARLVKALLPMLGRCLARYESLYILDLIMGSCIAELGVPLTREQGFHQVDLRGNISGFLSAHPQSPAVSLHHVELVDPIFPNATREASLGRLMAAARADPSRLLQQSFCYARALNWTMAVSFGYSVQVYEHEVEPRVLQAPLQTFKEWRRSIPSFTFAARRSWSDPCEEPHVFYLQTVEEKGDAIASTYARHSAKDLPLCGNYSANGLSAISVATPKRRRVWVGGRRECCDVVDASRNKDHAVLRVRACRDGETIY